MTYKDIYLRNRQLYNVLLKGEDGISNKSRTISRKKTSDIKWTELEHNGVMFYPNYVPHNIPIKYDNEEIHLNVSAEEFATLYVQPRYDKYKNDKFKKNFFRDWKKLLSDDLKKKIVDFNKCNFDEIKEHSIKNKSVIKFEDKEKYAYAMVDGTKQTIDNYLVEPPSIFVGRGNHPLIGSIKTRIVYEDVILNIGHNMKVPVVYNSDGTQAQWNKIISDNTLEWIACWPNNVTHKYNYARFGRKSIFKMKSDEAKFDKARMLKKKINRIRTKNEENMKSSDKVYQQLATALYLIDKLALRIGNEKTEDEADTVGITTLKIKNVSLLDNFVIKFDFLGKDSIRYVNKFKVSEIVYNNIKSFYEDNKSNNDDLFDLIDADKLNKYIKKFMKNLTSKVFRTFNASYLMQIELKKITNKYATYDKPDRLQRIVHEYEMANLKVAKLCNHQRQVSSSSTKQTDKINEQIKVLQSKIGSLKRKSNKTEAITRRINAMSLKLKNYKNKKTKMIEGKTLSGSTSKTNYIDPRITVAFVKTNGLEIEKFFNKAHLDTFKWATVVDENFKF